MAPPSVILSPAVCLIRQITSKPASSASGLQISLLPWLLTSILLVNFLTQHLLSILHLATQAFLGQIFPYVCQYLTVLCSIKGERIPFHPLTYDPTYFADLPLNSACRLLPTPMCLHVDFHCLKCPTSLQPLSICRDLPHLCSEICIISSMNPPRTPQGTAIPLFLH